MNAAVAEFPPASSRAASYARCVVTSRDNDWQIDRDLLRGRSLDFGRKFLPDGLSLVDRIAGLSNDEERLLSQIQGRTYAYIFGLVERFISVKMLEQGRAHGLGDQLAFEGLVRFANEEIKHQELFRRIDQMIGADLPAGYRQVADPNHVAQAVLAASAWSVLALTCHIELFVQSHYVRSIAERDEICPLFRDVFKFHWKDECRHVVLDELEWSAEDARLTPAQRDAAVDDFIALVGAVDSLLVAQAAADAEYFATCARRDFSEAQRQAIEHGVLRAYRWQYIVSGVQHTRFAQLLGGMTTPAQLERIQRALAPIRKDLDPRSSSRC